ncbi:MAG: nucleotide-binding protein [Nitrospira sp.]|nr:nucleotide-binding protein [Nitrospira sp.]
MKLPVVFIASSTEGFEVAQTARLLLLDQLLNKAEVTLWTREFDLSATYIESLEKCSQQADFAILVVTPDDITISRSKRNVAPRDNVIFELGLFMGCLGRERCFILNEGRSDLKLPTDLLGIHTATFDQSADAELQVALNVPCIQIRERIVKLGTRYKFSKETSAAQVANRRFCSSIEGAWWERIVIDDAVAMSFLQIELDDVFNSVLLIGQSYNLEGHHVAKWKSTIARVESHENKLIYHWKGWHTGLAHASFHGFGEMEFNKPIKLGDEIVRGGGKFWDINEAHPEKTIVKPMQLRRIQEDGIISTMTKGDEEAVRSLVRKTLLEW